MATRNEEQKAIRTYRAAMKASAAPDKKSQLANKVAHEAKQAAWAANETANEARNNRLRVLGGI